MRSKNRVTPFSSSELSVCYSVVVVQLTDQRSWAPFPQARFPLGDWVVMSSVFVASQSSREQSVENRLQAGRATSMYEATSRLQITPDVGSVVGLSHITQQR